METFWYGLIQLHLENGRKNGERERERERESVLILACFLSETYKINSSFSIYTPFSVSLFIKPFLWYVSVFLCTF